MDILNKTLSPWESARRGNPHVEVFDFKERGGGKIVLDRNSLFLAKLIGGEDNFLDKLPVSTATLKCGLEPFPVKENPAPSYLVFLMTGNCNLNCSYCFVEKNELQADEPISLDVVKKTLSIGDFKTFGFFGGEPLLYADRVFEIADFLKRKIENPRFNLTTNGTLVTSEIARKLADYGFNVIVSIDGPGPIHNAKRGESFSKTMRGIRLLSSQWKRGLRNLTLRATFAPDALFLAERAEFLCRELLLGKTDSVALQPASLRPGETWDADKLEIEYREFGKVLSSYQNAAGKFFQVSKLASRLLEGRPYYKNCGAGKGYVSVSSKGEVFACHRKLGLLGDVNCLENGLKDFEIKERPECKQCWARYICGGGCWADKAFSKGNEQCLPTLLLIREIIFLLGLGMDFGYNGKGFPKQ